MDKLKVLFVGIGSIAKRHIHNLQIVANKRGIAVSIDAFRRSTSKSVNGVEGVRDVYVDIDNVPDDYDVVFITNPTQKHLETLKLFHHKGRHFFIEKPVVSLDQIDDAQSFKLRKESVYYVACPLRYNAVIQWIKENINKEDVISIRSISSSYLPEWRPGQDYRQTYSAHKDMGGGVSIDLIHEWDYISYLFGIPDAVRSFIGKKSNLEIDSDDYAIYIAEYDEMIAELHLDYFGRKTLREIQLFTKNDTIVGDIANNKIYISNMNKVIDFQENRDDYQIRELEYFIDMVREKIKKEECYYHGLKILELTQGRA